MTHTIPTFVDPISFIEYNGIRFGPTDETPADFTTYPPRFNLDAEFVYDESDRVIMYTRYTLNITTIVRGRIHIEGQMGFETVESARAEEANRIAQIRTRLSQPAAIFRLQGLGIGNLIWRLPGGDVATTVGSPGGHGGTPNNITVFDVRPRGLSLQPLGGNIAYELNWICEFCVCEPPSANAGNLALSYAQTWSVDGAGYNSRLIQGVAQVSGGLDQTKNPRAAGTLMDFRSKLRVEVPPGFERVQQSYTMSDDLLRMDFTIADRQLRETPFPPGLVAFDVDETVQMRTLDSRAYTWLLSGSAEASADHDPSVAATALLQYMFTRAREARRLTVGDSASQQGKTVIPFDISYARKRGSRVFRLSVRFEVKDNSNNPFNSLNILGTEELPWEPWAKSMENNWGSRGAEQFEPLQTQDTIVRSRCDGPQNFRIGKTSSRAKPTREDQYTALDCFVTPETSYVSMDRRLVAMRQEQAAEHKMSQSYFQRPDPKRSMFGSNTFMVGPPTVAPSTSTQQDTVLEFMAGPIYRVRYDGVSIRVGFPPEVPPLVDIDGRRVTLLSSDHHETQIVGDLFGCPVYRLRWSYLYKFDGGGVQFGALADPGTGIPDSEGSVLPPHG